MRTLERPDLKAAASPALMARGCVNVIGLEAFREKAGARWEKIRGGVYTRLEQMLRQRLGPADFFVQLDDTAFLVTMPAAESDDAKIACLGVAYDLYVGYLGQCDIDSICLYRAAQGAGDTIVIERIETDQLKVLAERAGAQGDARKSKSQTDTQEPKAAVIKFLPLWDARKEAITTYLCVPQRVSSQCVPSATLALRDLSPKRRAMVELSCLEQGTAILKKHLDRGERFLMGFGISYETLSWHTARIAFIGACRELSSEFRQYLVFVLTDFPPGVPPSRLSELVMSVKPYAKAVMSEIPSFCRSHADYQGIGLQAIGLNLERAKLTRKEMPDEIARLATAAKRLSLSTFLTDVSDGMVLSSARQEKIHFLTGPAISPVLNEPRPMTRLHWHEVMAEVGRPCNPA